MPLGSSVFSLFYPCHWCVGFRVVCSKRSGGTGMHEDPAVSGLSLVTQLHAIGIKPLRPALVRSFVRSINCKPNWTGGDWLGSSSAGFARASALALFWSLVRHQSACLPLFGLQLCVELCLSSAKGLCPFVLARLDLNLQPLFHCSINCFYVFAFELSFQSSFSSPCRLFGDLAVRLPGSYCCAFPYCSASFSRELAVRYNWCEACGLIPSMELAE